MKYRKLGRSGLKVSEISLGSWLTYGNSVERDRAIATIHQAYELGINFFDTANVYMRGEAEKVVGDALSQFPRESYVLATKVFFPMGDGVNDRGLSRKHVFEQLHASLRRLKQDYVDIYYCHRYDAETPIDETLRTIDDLVTQGKVLYVGVSEWTAAQIVEALNVSERYMLDRIVVNQPVYNMLNRYIEHEVIPVSAKAGIGQVVFSPLAQGLLTGKYRKDQEIPQNARAADPKANMYMGNLLSDENLNKVEQLIDIASELQIPLSQLALAWILRQPNVSSALIGASRPEQVVENVKAIDVTLNEEILQRIEDILTQ